MDEAYRRDRPAMSDLEEDRSDLRAQHLQLIFGQELALMLPVLRRLITQVPEDERRLDFMLARATALSLLGLRVAQRVLLQVRVPVEETDATLHGILEYLHNQICGTSWSLDQEPPPVDGGADNSMYTMRRVGRGAEPCRASLHRLGTLSGLFDAARTSSKHLR